MFDALSTPGSQVHLNIHNMTETFPSRISPQDMLEHLHLTNIKVYIFGI